MNASIVWFRDDLRVADNPALAAAAADASALYARNLLDFLKLVFTPEGQFQINLEDDIVAACLMCRDGQVVRKNG